MEYSIIDPVWFAKHKDHDVRPRSEYGYAFNDCIEWIKCQTCGRQVERCGLKDGHAGDHQSRKLPGT